MAQPNVKRIILHMAVNERGDHCVSEQGPQEALDGVVERFGGQAFRVFDVALDLPLASLSEVTERRAAALDLKLVKV